MRDVPYETNQKTQLISKILEIRILEQVAYISQRTANIHCMLDILMSRSNNQVHIDEINDSVTEKKLKTAMCNIE